MVLEAIGYVFTFVVGLFIAVFMVVMWFAALLVAWITPVKADEWGHREW